MIKSGHVGKNDEGGLETQDTTILLHERRCDFAEYVFRICLAWSSLL